MNILRKYRDLMAPFQSSLVPLVPRTFFYFECPDAPDCNGQALDWQDCPDDDLPFRYVTAEDIQAVRALQEGALADHIRAIRMLSLRYSAFQLAELLSFNEAICCGLFTTPGFAQQLIDILYGPDEELSESAPSGVRFSIAPSSGRFSIAPDRRVEPERHISLDLVPREIGNVDNEEAELEQQELIAKAMQVREDINALKNRDALAVLAKVLGPELLQQLLHPHQACEHGTLRIDSRFRILLSEHDIEIRMSALPKALYILFLRHPEGIERKRIDECRDELRTIYLTISGRTDIGSMNRSIDDLVEPGGSSLNEKISKINHAFRCQLAPDVADQFVVAGPRGEKKRILAASTAQLPDELRF